jgi:WD40 repeat protein
LGYVWSFPDGIEISHFRFLWTMNQSQHWGQNCYTSTPDDNWQYAFGTSDAVNAGFITETHNAGLYKLSDGSIQYTIDETVISYSISPDGNLVALSTGDKLILIQYEDGMRINEIAEPGITSVYFFPDNSTIAAIFQGKVKYYSVDGLQNIGATNVQNAYKISFSPDNRIFVIHQYDNGLRLYRTEDKGLINALSGTLYQFTSDSQGLLVDTGKDMPVGDGAFVYNTKGPINYYQFKPDLSNVILTQSFSGVVLTRLSEEVGAISVDESKLLSTDFENLDVYDLLTGTKILEFPFSEVGDLSYYNGPLNTIWNPASNNFIINMGGLYARYLGIIDLQTGQLTKILANENETMPSALAFSPNSDLLVSIQGKRVLSWDIKNCGYWQLSDYPSEIPQNLYSSPQVFFSNDGNTIHLIDSFMGIHDYKTADYQSIPSDPGMSVFIAPGDFSPDGKLNAVITGQHYGPQLTILDLASNATLYQSEINFCLNYDALDPLIEFSPDGNYLAVMCSYGYPQIWGIP